MSQWLTSLTLENFRSIRGTVTIPLDAPLVLMYGTNASGKTSVFSAIELALTGEVAALARTSSHYEQHLVHHDMGSGGVELRTSGLSLGGGGQQTATATLNNGAVQVQRLLDDEMARYFRERCYLPQSALSRLLEAYQYSGNGEGSELMHFVRELLDLDRVEALVDGLQASSDVRRVRRLVPAYSEHERELASLEVQLDTAKNEMEEIRKRWVECEQGARRGLVLLGYDERLVREADVRDIELMIGEMRERAELRTLAHSRLELEAIRDRQGRVANDASRDRKKLEQEGIAASDARSAWVEKHGEGIESFVAGLRGMFDDIPDPRLEPTRAVRVARDRLGGERQRLDALLASDAKAATGLADLEEPLAKTAVGIQVLEDELEAGLEDHSGLAQVLAGVLAHVDGEECPVCGRDFSEKGEGSLHAHVTETIDALTKQGEVVAKLVRERVALRRELDRLRRHRDDLAGRRIPQTDRARLQTRTADLSESLTRLDAIESTAVEGQLLMDEERRAKGVLKAVDQHGEHLAEIRAATARLHLRVTKVELNEEVSTDTALASLEGKLAERERVLQATSDQRNECQRALGESRELAKKVKQACAMIELVQKRHTRVSDELAEATRRYERARQIRKEASRVRASVVSGVLDDRLNSIWRELFTRLAPNEPFMPAFVVPSADTRRVPIQFETLHRDGGRGGPPAAMLSAGNLNTAALSLFLALHLAAQSRLPFLLLDDPVQAMDEVHIAQLAVVLRSLARDQSRQIILAVHERPLFEYLSLELSPAERGERLITVEIDQPAGVFKEAEWETSIDTTIHPWQEDPVTFAA